MEPTFLFLFRSWIWPWTPMKKVQESGTFRVLVWGQAGQTIHLTHRLSACVCALGLLPTLNWQGQLQRHARHLELAKVLRAWKATLPSLCRGRLGSAPPPLVQVQSKLSGEGTGVGLWPVDLNLDTVLTREQTAGTFYLTVFLKFSRISDPLNVVCLRFWDLSFFGGDFSPASSDHEKQI